jgi:hypothetical protein
LKSQAQRFPKTSILTSGLPGSVSISAWSRAVKAKHEDEGNDRVEDLDGEVVAQLHRETGLALAAAVRDRGPDDEAPRRDADDQKHDPRRDPQAHDAARVVGGIGITGQKALQLSLRAPGENHRDCDRDGDDCPST